MTDIPVPVLGGPLRYGFGKARSRFIDPHHVGVREALCELYGAPTSAASRVEDDRASMRFDVLSDTTEGELASLGDWLTIVTGEMAKHYLG